MEMASFCAMQWSKRYNGPEVSGARPERERPNSIPKINSNYKNQFLKFKKTIGYNTKLISSSYF